MVDLVDTEVFPPSLRSLWRVAPILADLSVSFSQIDGFKTSPWGTTHTLLSTPLSIQLPPSSILRLQISKISKSIFFSYYCILKMLPRIRSSMESIIHFIDLKRWGDKIRARLEFFLCKRRQCGVMRVLLWKGKQLGSSLLFAITTFHWCYSLSDTVQYWGGILDFWQKLK